ncbi:death domain-containing membrane protein NRADD-like [Chlamydotis macqueenii]
MRSSQWRSAPPCPARGEPLPAPPSRGGAERSRTWTERSRTGTERSRTGTERSRRGSERPGGARLGAGRGRGRARVSAMRPVLLLLGLGLLCPAPGRGGGCCTPCPPALDVAQPCGRADARCQPCAHAEALATGPPRAVTPPEAGGEDKDVIPVYCALLAAVVVGLLAYVAFKCWRTCRQKRRLAKARAGDAGSSGDGEKLQGDGGVFGDAPDPQGPHRPDKAPHPEGHPLSAVVPAQRQEELERLLESGGPGGDWRGLAARLGFGPDAIGDFGRGRAPTRALLAAWAAGEGAAPDTLCQALAAMGHRDAARRLAGDATSAV